jgi:hypothetical protein
MFSGGTHENVRRRRHCGRVRFPITTELAHVAECNCSICTKKGFLHLIVPPEHSSCCAAAHHLRVQHADRQAQFCRHCGIHAFYVPRSDPDKFSTCDDVDLTKIRPDAFDGEHWEEAIRHYVR